MVEEAATPRGTAQRGGLFRLAFKAMQKEGLTWREYHHPWGVHIVTWCPTLFNVPTTSAMDADIREDLLGHSEYNNQDNSFAACSPLDRFTRTLWQAQIHHRCCDTPYTETPTTPLLMAVSGRANETQGRIRVMTTVHVIVFEPFIQARLSDHEVNRLLERIASDPEPVTNNTELTTTTSLQRLSQ